MSHDGIIGHCGYVGEKIGTMTLVDDQTGVTIKINKGSRGAIITVFSTGGMDHKQVERAKKVELKVRHRFYEAIQVGDEEIYYSAKVSDDAG